MKGIHKSRATILAGLLAGAGIIFSFPQDVQAIEQYQNGEALRIAVANEPPYGYLNEEGVPLGVGPVIAQRILDTLGIEEVEWVVVDFGHLLPGLEVGRFHMAAAEMAILPQRCQRVLFSEPNTSYGEGLLVRSSNPHQIMAYEDFVERDDLKAGVVAGTTQEELLTSLGVPSERLVILDNDRQAISAILEGRIHAYAATGQSVAALEMESREVQAEYNFIDPVVDGEEIRYWGGFAFPLWADDLRDAVNGELRRLRQEGTWEQVLQQYGFLQKDILYAYRFDTERLCNGPDW